MSAYDKAIDEAYAIMDNAHALGFDARKEAFRHAVAVFLRALVPTTTEWGTPSFELHQVADELEGET